MEGVGRCPVERASKAGRGNDYGGEKQRGRKRAKKSINGGFERE